MLHLPGPSGLARRYSRDYREAAKRFIDAAGRLGDTSMLQSIAHTSKGPGGEPLAVDYAWLGDPQASRVLVTQSAVHGVEGFAGSAIQVDHLLGLPEQGLPQDVAVLHIHALNPHGFAWCRRVNEDGVDLNRNFVDFSRPLPGNRDYEELRHLLVPDNMNRWAECGEALSQYEEQWGTTRFERAVSGGQYADPAGLFYGGSAPSWSRRTLEALFLELELGKRQFLAVLDLHTGLGPYGYGELICDHPPQSRGVDLARSWYGDNVTEPALGTSASVPKQGLIDYAWQAAFGDNVCFLTLEFGSYPFVQLMDALRRDHALHAGAVFDGTGQEHGEVRQSMIRHFYPRAADWQQAVLFRARQVIDMALEGLSTEKHG
jgi:hypothetical protein